MAGWIKKGMIVVSMTNIDIPLTVEDFIYKSGEFVDKEGNKYRKKCLIGVQCYRFDENKAYMKGFIAKSLFLMR